MIKASISTSPSAGMRWKTKKFSTEARKPARVLIRTIDQKGPVNSGSHRNSRIAVFAYNVANAALRKLD